jgi:hypothetical protein
MFQFINCSIVFETLMKHAPPHTYARTHAHTNISAHAPVNIEDEQLAIIQSMIQLKG